MPPKRKTKTSSVVSVVSKHDESSGAVDPRLIELRMLKKDFRMRCDQRINELNKKVKNLATSAFAVTSVLNSIPKNIRKLPWIEYIALVNAENKEEEKQIPLKSAKLDPVTSIIKTVRKPLEPSTVYRNTVAKKNNGRVLAPATTAGIRNKTPFLVPMTPAQKALQIFYAAPMSAAPGSNVEPYIFRKAVKPPEEPLLFTQNKSPVINPFSLQREDLENMDSKEIRQLRKMSQNLNNLLKQVK